MRYKIYFEIGDYQDTLIVDGDNIEEIREKIDYELKKRGATYTGAEEL